MITTRSKLGSPPIKKNLKDKNTSALKIKEMRLVVSSSCPYSCYYCNLYYKKLLDLKRITFKELHERYKIGNESYGILSKITGSNLNFNIQDYRFLFKTLHNYFGLEDITFTGGDPFLNPDIKKIINLAHSFGLRTTAITKGAPLFKIKNKNSAKELLGNLSRIIFSLDSLDAKKYAQTNLLLLRPEKAITFLPQTLRIINLLANLGYNIEINSVVGANFKDKQELLNSFIELKKIIDFCLLNKVKKLKFIELDSYDTLGQPYIENYFKIMKSAKFFKDYKVIKKTNCKINKNLYSYSKILILKRSLKDGGNMEVIAYRTHCPTNFIRHTKKKKCEFSQGGELHLDFQGRSFFCQRDVNFKFISIFTSVKNRDTSGLIDNIY